jgi:3D (Asp-Asp-Asp) domain-containing protein
MFMHKLVAVIFCLPFLSAYAQEQVTSNSDIHLQTDHSILNTYLKENNIESPETLLALEIFQVPAAMMIAEVIKSSSEGTIVEKKSALQSIKVAATFQKSATSESSETVPVSSAGASSVAQKGLVPRKMRVRLTFYSGQDDQWGSRVAWQAVPKAKRGRTVAADPSILPYGTWVHIPGFGKMRVEDTGTAVKARTASGGQIPVIDVYVGSESEVSRLSNATPEYVSVLIYDRI